MENWRKIYSIEVSDHGNVRLFDTKELVHIATDSLGYKIIPRRYTDNTRERIHRLIAAAFLPNPENKKEVNHIDGDKGNNVLSNLEWATHQENMLHVRRVLKKNVEENHHWSKLKPHEVQEIWKLKHVYGLSHRLIASLYNICHQQVSNVTRKNNCWHNINFELGL